MAGLNALSTTSQPLRRRDRLVARHRFDRLDPVRHGAGAARPHQPLHLPAGVAERLGGDITEPARGAQNEDAAFHLLAF